MIENLESLISETRNILVFGNSRLAYYVLLEGHKLTPAEAFLVVKAAEILKYSQPRETTQMWRYKKETVEHKEAI